MMAAGAPGTEPLLPWTPRGVAQVDRAVRARLRRGTPACCSMAFDSRLRHMRLGALTRSVACCDNACLSQAWRVGPDSLDQQSVAAGASTVFRRMARDLSPTASEDEVGSGAEEDGIFPDLDGSDDGAETAGDGGGGAPALSLAQSAAGMSAYSVVYGVVS